MACLLSVRTCVYVCRGFFNVNSSLANDDGVFPDTYINVGKYSWAKGVAFINGFNLVSAPQPCLRRWLNRVSLHPKTCSSLLLVWGSRRARR